MTLQNYCEVTGVRWNPRLDNLFATSDNRGRVYLRDVRTSFGSSLNRTRQPLEQVRPPPSAIGPWWYLLTLARR